MRDDHLTERAIVQQVIHRDGGTFVQACMRPDHVRAQAERVSEFRFKPTRCHECRRNEAVALTTVLGSSRELCRACFDKHRERRAIYQEVHRSRSVVERDDSSQREIRGYPIVFDKQSVDLGGFREYIRPSAADRIFTDNLDVRALVDHDSARIIGRRSAGTIVLNADKRGVHVAIDPGKTTAARDIYESVSRRDVTGGSFAFRTLEDDWYLTDDGTAIRDVLDMVVSEVSVVSFPAYPDTSITAGARGSFRDVEWLKRVHRARLAR